jgi:SAM-dependent methyltransferase
LTVQDSRKWEFAPEDSGFSWEYDVPILCLDSCLMAESDLEYVHGYSEFEQRRLCAQAVTLSELLHCDTQYEPGAQVLEAGCGVGAQTELLVERSPGAQFTSIDVSPRSLDAACQRLAAMGGANVAFQLADIYQLPFPDDSFDHVFLCFVLEHLTDPVGALVELRRVLRRGGTLTAIEGDHGSAYYHPQSSRAQTTIDCLVRLQAQLGGNALIGRELYPLLRHAGFESVRTEPRTVYTDSSRPEWVEGFTKATFISMVMGVKAEAVAQGLLDEEAWDQGILDLTRTSEAEGTFSYTFFKSVAFK